MTTSRLTDEQVDFLERRAAGGRLPTLHEVRALLSEVRERREGERIADSGGRNAWRCHCGRWNYASCQGCGKGPDERWASAAELDALAAPAAGSPDTRTLGNHEGEPAAADPREGTGADSPAHMKNEGE